MSRLEVADTEENVLVTIPKSLLREAGLEVPPEPGVRREGDELVVTLRRAGEAATWDELFSKMDEQKIAMSDEEIEEAIQACRRERREGGAEYRKTSKMLAELIDSVLQEERVKISDGGIVFYKKPSQISRGRQG